MSKKIDMALKKISVVVLISFLSFADAETCDRRDVDQARQACKREELCITLSGKNAKSFMFSEETTITVECHYNGGFWEDLNNLLPPEDINITWKKNNRKITNTTKCWNLKTVIQLSPHTGSVFYTCEKRGSSSNLSEVIDFIYVDNENTPRSTPRTTSRPTSTPTSMPTPTPTPRPAIRTSSKPPEIDATILDMISATIKVTVNGDNIGEVTSTSMSGKKNDLDDADYYYFNHEIVNVTCALVISGHNTKSSYLLEAHNNKKCIHDNINGTEISHKQELTDLVAELKYQCNLYIGDKAEGERCVKTERRALFTLHYKFAELKIYINNEDKVKETTENGSEIVYTYNQENVTIQVKCSHADEVYNRRHILSPAIIWDTKQLNSTYMDNSKPHLKNPNTIIIPLFADQSNSYLDCVEDLGNQVSINKEYQPTRIRLRFIYDAEVIGLSDPKDADPNKDRDQKDADPNKERDQKDADPNKERDQKDAEAISTCDLQDAERAKMCGQKEICITVDNKIVTSYNYSQEMNISVVCHYNGWDGSPIEDNNFTIHWKNGDDIISNEEKCRNLKKVIHLSPDNNKTVYTCEKYSNAAFKTDDITFLYVPKETLNERFKSFFKSNSILLAAGLVLFIVVIAVIVAIWVVLKSRKGRKEDKRRLNPKGSRESLEDIPKQYRETPSEPRLNEQYTDLNADTISELYSDPYPALYTQPLPKNLRKIKVLPELPPKPKLRNEEHYLNTSGLVYKEPSTYNYINSNTRIIAENTGATYNNIGKSSKHTGATYNNIGKSSKHTGATYNNIGKNCKHTGTTYNNLDKSLKNTQHVHFYDNMAASYSNAENEKCSSDVYSEPGLYEEPS